VPVCIIRGKIIRTALCCVLYDSCAQFVVHTCEHSLHFCFLGVDFVCVYLGFVFCVYFHVSLVYIVLVLLAFVVLGLVSSVLS